MKLFITQTITFVILIILILSLSSCNNGSIPQVSDTPYYYSTQTLIGESVQTTSELLPPTPIPSITPGLNSMSPTIGSILRWFDLSAFVYVPENEYLIGGGSSVSSNNSSSHLVTLNGFWIQQHEVTKQQYAQCVIDGYCSPLILESDEANWLFDPQKTNYPVVGVTWYQGQEYCRYIDARLPTEAEWEAAAKNSNKELSTMDIESQACENDDINDCGTIVEPTIVGSNPADISEFLAMDMTGNVFEWVNDWYDDTYFGSSSIENPTGPENGTQRVYRGGTSDLDSYVGTSITRYSTEPMNHASNLGFRCVLAFDPFQDDYVSISRPCQVVSKGSVPENQPTNTPFPCSIATINASCQFQNSNPVITFEIQQAGCLGSVLNSVTTNSLPLSCSVTQLSNGIYQYLCSSPGLIQGSSVEITYCNNPNPRNMMKKCPIGYEFDQNTLFCELQDKVLPVIPCPQGYIDIPPNGCLPLNDLAYGNCPVGFYSVTTSLDPVCMPLDSCLLPNPPDYCKYPSCSTGDVYDLENGCCTSSDQPKLICPTGYSYFADQKTCLFSEMYPSSCSVEQVRIPFCPIRQTPTAESTHTPVPPTPNPFYPCIRTGWDPVNQGWIFDCP